MHTFSKLVLTASLLQIASSVSADEWPADPIDTISAPGQMVITDSGTKSEKALVDESKEVDTSKLPRKPKPQKHFGATTKQSPPTTSSKHASFGNAMSAQANKMATTENPYNNNSSASVIAERRGDLAAQRGQSHPHR